MDFCLDRQISTFSTLGFRRKSTMLVDASETTFICKLPERLIDQRKQHQTVMGVSKLVPQFKTESLAENYKKDIN